jgi:AraC-like DNA-binding protein
MRIARTDTGWRILAPALPAGACLKALAAGSGYRVGGICERLGCSESYFRRVFLRDIGIAPKQWLRDQRMLAARRQLEEGRDLWDLADFLGFASEASFRREFRAVFGMLPARMRGRQPAGRL